jgi:actin related protein 2/3 complex subunit 5
MPHQHTVCKRDTKPSPQEIHLQTVLETLQQIRASEMTPLLQRIYGSEGGPEVLDTLTKYLYKGMSQTGSPSKPGVSPTPTGGFSQIAGRSFGGGEGGGQMMSVLLSWHEKVVEVAGVGSVVRVMTDRRTV